MNNNYGAIYQPYSSQYRPDTAILSQAEKDKLIEEEAAKRKAAESKRKSGFLPKTAEQLSSPYRAGQTISASGQQVGGIIGDVGKASYDGVVGGYKGLYDLAAPVVEGAGNLGRGVLGMREDTEEGFRYANQPQQSQAQPQGASEADLSALAQYRPDGILANAQDIDMGGKGVLRPDATVETGALNEEIIDTAEVLESEPASLMADNAIDKQGVKKESPLLGIAQAASIDRSGTATGNKRDSTSMSIPRIGMAERLMRIGGAITGASSQGLSASMAAGAQAYGGLQDEERRLEQQQYDNDTARDQELRKQQAAQAKVDAERFGSPAEIYAAQELTGKIDGLLSDLSNSEYNAVGASKNWLTNKIGGMMGTDEASIRLRLQELVVDKTLSNTAFTKGAISDKEMALFRSDIPQFSDSEEIWLKWLNDYQAATRMLEHNLRTGYAPYKEQNAGRQYSGGSGGDINMSADDEDVFNSI
tara:strand:- start:2346 stop:3770 length:1425 start_codon:yes stop_codon:yes gene_type:complete